MWLIAIAGALGFAVIVLALMTVQRTRIERRRSDARVAALAAAIDDPRWALPLENGDGANDVIPASTPVSLAVPDMPRPSRTPAFVVAGVVIVSVGALLFAGMNAGRRSPRHDVVSRTSSIELVSMRHALDGEALIVSGLVRNPATSATPPLSAVVSVLGRDGQVIARGESPLEPVVLGPGKETSFRVSIPEVGEPDRYRVAFVNGSQIVPHVDRRSELSRTALANDARGN